jgi:hypothetical protein
MLPVLVLRTAGLVVVARLALLVAVAALLVAAALFAVLLRHDVFRRELGAAWPVAGTVRGRADTLVAMLVADLLDPD